MFGKIFRKTWWLIIVLLLVSYLAFYNKKPCGEPIQYAIGSFDERFGISQTDFKDALSTAAAIWENPIGKKLFAYNSAGNLKINLIFDERQQLVEKKRALDATVGQNKQSSDAIKRRFESLKSQYETSQREYALLLDEFNKKSAAYNASVKYWNSRGGAPKSQYEKLEADKNNLMNMQNALEEERLFINALVGEINALIRDYNSIIGLTNAEIRKYNSSEFVGSEFEEGLYISDKKGERIEIYEFADKTQLVRVLAHEFGHALGLEHNNNPESIMYSLNQSRNKNLSANDLRALKVRCGLE